MKKSMWFSLAATVLYAVMNVAELVSHLGFRLLPTLVVFVSPLVPSVLIAIHILRGEKGGKGNNVLFAVATGWLLLSNLQTFHSSLRVLIQNPEVWSLWMFVAFDVALIVGMVLMFVGSLQDFRRSTLAQFGAFLNAGVTTLYILVAFIGAWVVSYFERVPDGVTAVNWLAFGSYLATALFYAGIGVFAVEKKREKALDFSVQE